MGNMRERPASQDQTTYSAREAVAKIQQVFNENHIPIALDRSSRLFKDGMTPEEVYNALLYLMDFHNIVLPVRREFFERKSSKV